MKKIVIAFTFLFFAFISTALTASNTIPEELSVREHWISLTKSYDIDTKTQKLGTLYRRFFSLLLTYDFYDPMDVKTATAKARFFSFGAHLDIYDQSGILIGGVEEKIFNFFPTFEIFGRDASTKLARAKMNFWGTKFYIYDPETDQEMAVMSRSFFRLKNDWTINVTNRNLLDQKNMDPRVLMTVIAVQGEIEDWKRDHQNDYSLRASAVNSKQSMETKIEDLAKKISKISAQKQFHQLEQPSQEHLEALAAELDNGFNAENQCNDNHFLSNQEQIEAFTSYCLNLVNSNDLSDEKKKAILSLLSLRIQGHN